MISDHVWCLLIVIFLLVLLYHWAVEGAPTNMSNRDAQLYYLVKYGYYVDADNPKNKTIAFESAMKRFQGTFGLEQTGYGDPETVKLMERPRCGVPDTVLTKHGLSRHKRFNIGSRSWRYKSMPLTYSVLNYSPDTETYLQDLAFDSAFQRWINVTNVYFEKTDSPDSDIKISFGRYKHGNCEYDFDGKSGILAHTFLPNDENGSLIHLDEDEDWGNFDGEFLTKIFTHEVGHSLGLSHSDNMDSLMNPFPSYDGPDWGLHEDDIKAITAIYGAKGKPFLYSSGF